ncbi:MAG: BrnA antitoxin family protein [Acidobacteria bacterium]|nr:BrnA antitoxin family protein [Acidobacteriota bacterium]
MRDRDRADLEKLARMPDSRIDYSDAPKARRPDSVLVGKFYRPVKQLVSLRVDADVLAWFRTRGKKYQTYMNEVLRREMQTYPRGRSQNPATPPGFGTQ